jgi:hypothetical protein
VRDYHSLHWLLYVYLQQGRYNKAEELLTLMKKTMSESTYDNKLRPGYYENNYANMAAAFVVETERWELASVLFPKSAASESTSAGPPASASHGTHGATPPSTAGPMTVRYSSSSQRLPRFIRELAAAVKGSTEPETVPDQPTDESPGNSPVSIGELEVAAVAASMKRNHDQAIASIKRAVAIEDQLGPPSGPPSLIKPTHELYGEILLRAGRPQDAVEQFKTALLRQPNRARSLLGAARAAAQSGDHRGAASAYAKLLEQWQQADRGLPALREAQDFLKQAKF